MNPREREALLVVAALAVAILAIWLVHHIATPDTVSPDKENSEVLGLEIGAVILLFAAFLSKEILALLKPLLRAEHESEPLGLRHVFVLLVMVGGSAAILVGYHYLSKLAG